jgi:hypothetical protein
MSNNIREALTSYDKYKEFRVSCVYCQQDIINKHHLIGSPLLDEAFVLEKIDNHIEKDRNHAIYSTIRPMETIKDIDIPSATAQYRGDVR